MGQFAHVAAASINQTVGDWSGNVRRIVAVLEETRRRGARLVVLPEMCISGYSLGDRLLMPATVDRSLAALAQIASHSAGLIAVVGLPIRHRDVLYNVAAVVADGRIVGFVPKENLATGDVQYENRWFAGWPRTRVETLRLPSGEQVPIGGLLFDAPGLGRFGIEICEDGWKGIRPGSVYALAGAHVLLNPSASWFVTGKHRIRRSLVEQISREDHCVYLYTSLLGCDATRLVFDGSVFIARDGDILEEGRRFLFTEDFEVIDRIVDIADLIRARAEEGSWRDQSMALDRGEFRAIPPVIPIAGDYSASRAPDAPAPYWIPVERTAVDRSLDWLPAAGLTPRIEERDLTYLELELALSLALREYARKSGVPGFALALSGGRDSSMCALLLARMYRYDQPGLDAAALKAHIHERFATAYMATENSGTATRRAARELADEIGARHFEGEIQVAVDTHLDVMQQMTGVRLSWQDAKHDIPLQNVQARLRGSLIWMIANTFNYLLISTSNKSESAVGYATMDGDTSGGLAPIADVSKSLVTLWVAWAARFHDIASMRHVLETPATAELRPASQAQTDEADLMPFFILDQLMHQFVQLGRDPLPMFQSLWPRLKEHYRGEPAAFARDIRRFVRLVCFAQWKRDRFAISFRVTAFDLDPKTGFRFPAVQMPFTEELAELDAYVARLT